MTSLRLRFQSVLTYVVSLALVIWLSSCATTRDNHFYKPYAGKGKQQYSVTGLASWYGHPFHGRRTASGERFDMNDMTCAHKSLPFGAMLKVTNLNNDRSVILKVNDRGPFVRGRIIDVSRKAADELAFRRAGIARVKIEWMDDPLDHPNLDEEKRSELIAKQEEPPAPVSETAEKEPPVIAQNDSASKSSQSDSIAELIVDGAPARQP